MGFYFRTPPLFPFLWNISLDQPNSQEKVSCCPHKCWQHNWPQPLMRGRLNQRRGTTVMLLVVFLPPTRHNIAVQSVPAVLFCLGHMKVEDGELCNRRKQGVQHFVAFLLAPLGLFTPNNYPRFCARQPPTLKGMLFNIEGASL